MCAVLPALLTGIILQAAVTHPLERENENLERQIKAQGPMPARQAMLKQLDAENAQLEKIANEKRKALKEGSPAGKAGFNRTVALQQISRLCEDGGLLLVSSAPDPSTKLPPAMAEAAKVLLRPGDASQPQVWRLEMRASYGEFLKFLNDLAGVPPMVVPLNLGMQPDPNEDNPISWTLTVWL
jgi:hypothetical protein